MKKTPLILASLAIGLQSLSATDYIQVKELMEKKEIETKVSFSHLSPFLETYVIGTSIAIEKKEGVFTGIALTTTFEGFVEMAEEEFSPLVSGSKKSFTVPADGSWTKVKISDERTYTIRLVQEDSAPTE